MVLKPPKFDLEIVHYVSQKILFRARTKKLVNKQVKVLSQPVFKYHAPKPC